MKKIFICLSDKYNLDTLLKNNCEEFKKNLGIFKEKLFSQDYLILVKNFIGKWINSYYIKNFGIKDLGFSNCCLNSDGILILSSIFYHNTDIQSLNLSGCLMKKQDFYRLRISSSRFKSIVSLSFDNNDLPVKAVEDLFEIIKNSPRLTNLELDHVNKYNALDNLFKCNSKKNRFKLETLTLRENNLNNNSCMLLLNFAENFSNLHSLNLGKNNLSSAFYYTLNSFFKKKRNFISLILDGNNLCDYDFEVFCEVIQNASTLVFLNLNNNNFTDKAARMIIESIKDHKSFSNLSMNNNKINNKILVKAINNLIKHNKNIKLLDFRSFFNPTSSEANLNKKDETKILLSL